LIFGKSRGDRRGRFAIGDGEAPNVIAFAGFQVVDDARALLSEGDVDFAPYGIAAYYAPTWNAWAEVALPNVAPIIGRSDPLRVGFTLGF